jgi:type IV pilus assembly protein PilP
MTPKTYFIKLLPVMLILLLMTACSEEKKGKDSSEQSKAVSKKIEKKIETSPSENQNVSVSDKSKESINNKPSSAVTSEVREPLNNTGVQPSLSQQSQVKTDIPVMPESLLKTGDAASQQPLVSAEKSVSAQPQSAQGQESTYPDDKDKQYNPAGKINPFISFISEEQEKKEDENSTDTVRKKRETLTPLEKIDIAQLKLTAITRTSTGNIALVEEPGGKGYVVTEGTYIGLNSGKVINVLADKIIIEEETENIFGKVSIQERELKLQKPTGE